MDSKRWIAVPLVAGMIVAACGTDDEADATEAPATLAPATAAPATTAPATEVPATAAPATEVPATEAPGPEGAASGNTMILGDETIALASVFCFFEEQPRAGLGGVFTHTLQARATNAAGADVILDVSRARDEDGTVSDDVTVDIGDPREDDFVGLRAAGPEGVVTFGETSATATDVSVTDFETDPVNLSFEASCG